MVAELRPTPLSIGLSITKTNVVERIATDAGGEALGGIGKVELGSERAVQGKTRRRTRMVACSAAKSSCLHLRLEGCQRPP